MFKNSKKIRKSLLDFGLVLVLVAAVAVVEFMILDHLDNALYTEAGNE